MGKSRLVWRCVGTTADNRKCTANLNDKGQAKRTDTWRPAKSQIGRVQDQTAARTQVLRVMKIHKLRPLRKRYWDKVMEVTDEGPPPIVWTEDLCLNFLEGSASASLSSDAPEQAGDAFETAAKKIRRPGSLFVRVSRVLDSMAFEEGVSELESLSRAYGGYNRGDNAKLAGGIFDDMEQALAQEIFNSGLRTSAANDRHGLGGLFFISYRPHRSGRLHTIHF